MPIFETLNFESNGGRFLGDFGMETSDFFRSRIDTMINLGDPLAVLATRLPWEQIEAALAPMFAHTDRAGVASAGVDLFGPNLAVTGAGRSNAGRPRLPIRLMASLLYLKHSFNLSDEEVAQRWSENVLWVRRRNRQGAGGASPLQ